MKGLAALMLMAWGSLLVSTRLQEVFSAAASRWTASGQTLLTRLTPSGLHGQFVLGLLLGLVWTPCVGPTLGATLTLASQTEHLGGVAARMAAFGVGAGAPLMAVGLASRQAAVQWRGRLVWAGIWGRRALGSFLLVMGVALLTGWDKVAESVFLRSAPPWLVEISTSL